MPDMRTFDAAFLKLGKSRFRSRFRLSAVDKKYISDKGLEVKRGLYMLAAIVLHCPSTRFSIPWNCIRGSSLRGHSGCVPL